MCLKAVGQKKWNCSMCVRELEGKRKKGMRYFLSLAGLICFLSIIVLADSAWALPWDTDLFKQQSYKANELSRYPAKGSIPRAFKPFRMSTAEAEKSLGNPVPATSDSLHRGQRLWNANCMVCHGIDAHGKTAVGGVSAFGIPDLHKEAYVSSSDGRVFGVVFNGGANMPRYGYKFSESEVWDIINYLRKLQRR